MISRKDLAIIKHTDKTKKLLASQPISELLSLVKHWLNVPELRPSNTTRFADYKELQHNKSKVIERILHLDWQRGFHSIQIAQLEIHVLIVKESARSWYVGRILTATGKLRLDLDAAAIKESIEDFISKYVSCYIYVLHHKETDLYWMRIEIFPKTENTSLSHREVTFVIFYPQTEFIILSGRVTNRNARTYIKQAILKTYGGEKIDSQHHRGGIISQITSIIRTRKSQGVFAQLRHNQVDSNPLDIRQKAPVRLEHEQESASTSDLNRRLKAVDQDDINLRRKIVLENYGHSFATSTTSLKVATTLPFNPGHQNENGPTIKFELNLSGSNIAQGVKNMIQMGRIDVNAPDWLTTIASTGATQLYVTKDGATEVEPEESDMEDIEHSQAENEKQEQTGEDEELEEGQTEEDEEELEEELEEESEEESEEEQDEIEE